MTLDRVKVARQTKAERPGPSLLCMTCSSSTSVTVRDLERLADIYQELHPASVLTHSLEDPHNFDHPEATRFAREVRIVAQAPGRRGAEAAIYAPPVFRFKPHQPEQCNWKPQVILAISPHVELLTRYSVAKAHHYQR